MSIQTTYCRMALCLALANPLVLAHAQQKTKKPSPQAAAKEKTAQLNTALFKAIAKKDVAEMERLIKRGANVNAQNEDSVPSFLPFAWTPLIHAIETNSMTAIRLLINRGANVNAAVLAGYLPDVKNAWRMSTYRHFTTALGFAVAADQPETVQLLLKSGAKLFTKDLQPNGDFVDPLALAARYNKLKTAKVLIKAGLTPLKAADGYEALAFATTNNSHEMIKLLRQAGVAPQACGAAMLQAISQGNNDTALLLLEGTNSPVKDEYGNPALILVANQDYIAFTEGQIANATGSPRNPESIKAAKQSLELQARHQRQTAELAHEIIARGANPDELSTGGYTALLLALEKGNIPLVTALLENGANPNFAPPPFPAPLRFLAAHRKNISFFQKAFVLGVESQYTLQDLERESQQADTSLAQILVKHGADPRKNENSGAIVEAVMHDKTALVKYLLSAGADPNALATPRAFYFPPSERGLMTKAKIIAQQEKVSAANKKVVEQRTHLTALHCAAYRGTPETTQLLIAAGANVNALDSLGENALHHLANGGRIATIMKEEREAATIEDNKLIDAGLMEYDLVEPLPAPEMIHRSQWANSNDTAVAQALLKAGCPVNIPNKKGKTAFDMAIPGAAPGVIEAMLKAGAEPSKTNALFDLINSGRCQRRTKAALTKLQLDLIEWDRFDLWYTDDLKQLQIKAKQEAKTNRARSLAQRTQILRTWGAVDARVAALLLQNKVEVDARNSAGLTPLMAAARVGQIEVVRELIRAGADVNAVDRNGETVLMQVIRYGGRSLQAMPVKQTVTKDKRGESWLTLPVTQRREALIRQVLGRDDAAVLQLLIKSGAKTGTRNKAGLTPLAIARQVHHPEAIAVLSGSKN